MREAVNDKKKALQTLRGHYAGKGEPHIINYMS